MIKNIMLVYLFASSWYSGVISLHGLHHDALKLAMTCTMWHQVPFIFSFLQILNKLVSGKSTFLPSCSACVSFASQLSNVVMRCTFFPPRSIFSSSSPSMRFSYRNRISCQICTKELHCYIHEETSNHTLHQHCPIEGPVSRYLSEFCNLKTNQRKRDTLNRRMHVRTQKRSIHFKIERTWNFCWILGLFVQPTFPWRCWSNMNNRTWRMP